MAPEKQNPPKGRVRQQSELGVNICEGAISPFESLFTLGLDVEKKVSPTINLGLLWDPTDWLSFGMLYQSQANDTLEGSAYLELNEDVLRFFGGLAYSNESLAILVDQLQLNEENRRINSKGSIKISMPSHFSVGTSIMLTRSLKLNVDWKWSNTDAWDEINVKIEKDIPLLKMLSAVGVQGIKDNAIVVPRGYEDASNFAFGLEYEWDDRTSLRFGYEPRKTGVPKDRRDFLVPVGDIDLYGFGVGYQYDRDTVIDLAIAYAKSEQYIKAGTSTNGNSMALDNVIYNPSAGLDVTTNLSVVVVEFGYQSTF